MAFNRTPLWIASGLALALASSPGAAQSKYPDHSVKVVVGFSAGGGTDVAARVITHKLSEAMAQTFVVENKAGANGLIASQKVSKSVADGYTIMVGSPSGMAIAWSSGAQAQSRRPIPIVGLVSIGSSLSNAANFGPFLEQMQELGYVDGKNIQFDRRFADGRDELISGFVADLVRLAVDIIVVTGTREGLAAKQATSTIPVVTIVAPDPVGMGLAQSLARPGGNVTGLTTMDLDIYGKRMALLKDVVPDLKKIGILVSPGKPEYNRTSEWARRVADDARSLGVAIDIVEADESNFDSVLSRLRADGARGLVVTSDGIFVAHRKLLAESAIKNRLPAIFSYRQQAEAGGLMAYAAKVADLSRRAAFFVDRILKGAKPADLPIERPSRFEFVVNRKTATALGLDVSAAILAQADEVIE